jgi:hypothetical protein
LVIFGFLSSRQDRAAPAVDIRWLMPAVTVTVVACPAEMPQSDRERIDVW